MTDKKIKEPIGWIGVEFTKPIEFKPNKHEIEVLREMMDKKQKRPEMITLKRDNGTNYKIIYKYINGHTLAEMHRS